MADAVFRKRLGDGDDALAAKGLARADAEPPGLLRERPLRRDARSAETGRGVSRLLKNARRRDGLSWSCPSRASPSSPSRLRGGITFFKPRRGAGFSAARQAVTAEERWPAHHTRCAAWRSIGRGTRRRRISARDRVQATRIASSERGAWTSSDSMMWRPHADHRGKHETGDARRSPKRWRQASGRDGRGAAAGRRQAERAMMARVSAPRPSAIGRSSR